MINKEIINNNWEEKLAFQLEEKLALKESFPPFVQLNSQLIVKKKKKNPRKKKKTLNEKERENKHN